MCLNYSEPVYNDHANGQATCGLFKQVVLVHKCFSATEVNNEPDCSGLFRQVIFVCKWSLRHVLLYIDMLIYTHAI